MPAKEISLHPEGFSLGMVWMWHIKIYNPDRLFSYQHERKTETVHRL